MDCIPDSISAASVAGWGTVLPFLLPHRAINHRGFPQLAVRVTRYMLSKLSSLALASLVIASSSFVSVTVSSSSFYTLNKHPKQNQSTPNTNFPTAILTITRIENQNRRKNCGSFAITWKIREASRLAISMFLRFAGIPCFLHRICRFFRFIPWKSISNWSERVERLKRLFKKKKNCRTKGNGGIKLFKFEFWEPRSLS